MHESCVFLSPCLHENSSLDSINMQAAVKGRKQFLRGWAADFKHAVLDCHL